MDNVSNLSPSVLCFVGDAVYGLLVRSHIAEINRPSAQLHNESIKWVSAPAQADAFEIIKPYLSENELSMFKRGRNFHTSAIPKNATRREYSIATGLETLFGYLHLSGNADRINQLFDIIKEGRKQD